jgi:hypothetical protein
MQDEEVSELEGAELSGVYKRTGMHQLEADDDEGWCIGLQKAGWSPEQIEASRVRGMHEQYGYLFDEEAERLGRREAEWTPEAMQALHVHRLRGPWGRLYAKELAKLRELLALLEAPLAEVKDYKALVQHRKSHPQPTAR